MYERMEWPNEMRDLMNVGNEMKMTHELDEQLREYINEWRKQRSKEEDELKRLKEKQAKRKEIRAEQEKKLAQQKVNKQPTFANKFWY